MKKYGIISFCLVVFLLMFSACGDIDDSELDNATQTSKNSDNTSSSVNDSIIEYTFKAKITEVNEKNIQIKPNDDTVEIKSSDAIIISISSDTAILDENDAEINLSELSVGQEIIIRYDGLIAESYPAQIIHCYDIQLINTENE